MKLAAPCGLYCRICSTFLGGICHGCGCEVRDCLAAKNMKSALFSNVIKKRDFKIVHHAHGDQRGCQKENGMKTHSVENTQDG